MANRAANLRRARALLWSYDNVTVHIIIPFFFLLVGKDTNKKAKNKIIRDLFCSLGRKLSTCAVENKPDADLLQPLTMSVMPSYSKSKDSKDLEDGGTQCLTLYHCCTAPLYP